MHHPGSEVKVAKVFQFNCHTEQFVDLFFIIIEMEHPPPPCLCCRYIPLYIIPRLALSVFESLCSLGLDALSFQEENTSESKKPLWKSTCPSIDHLCSDA